MIKNVSIGFLLSHPAHFFALGAGSGLLPGAPGTWGTLAAWGSFYALNAAFTPFQLAFFLTFCALFGLWCIPVTGKALGEVDHGSIVWDEIVPFWCLLALSPSAWYWHAAAFVLFRVFDILKPQPARFFDSHVKNGFGVMMDDFVAAGYALLVIQLAAYVWRHVQTGG